MPPKKKVLDVPADCMPMCSTCKLCEMNPEGTAGFCHLYPPVMVTEGDGYGFTHVVVMPDDWCRTGYIRSSN